jgi:hypothetical protein
MGIADVFVLFVIIGKEKSTGKRKKNKPNIPK